MDSSSKQKISNDMVEFNAINQLDITDMYGLLHLMTAGYTFFSCSHGTCTKIDNILAH